MSTPTTFVDGTRAGNTISNGNCDPKEESGNDLSQIKGFLVALNIRDHTQYPFPSRFTDLRPLNSSTFALPPFTRYSSPSHPISQTFGLDGAESSRCGPLIQPGFGGINWEFIDEIRSGAKDLWRRFQASVQVLNNERLRGLSSSYQDAEGLRNQGLLAFRETMLGQAPTELEKVFAMASMSYVISKALCAREALGESDILDGINIWVQRIAIQEDRETFNDLAQRLWQKHQTHLDTASVQATEPIFDLMNMNSSYQDPFSFNYPLAGPAPGQNSPIATSSVVSYSADQSHNGTAGPHAYTPASSSLAPGDPSSSNYGHEPFAFGGTVAESSSLIPGAYMAGWPESQNVSAPWNPMVYGFANAFSQPMVTPENAVDELVDTPDHSRACDEIRGSKSFCVLPAMFSYLDNSLGRLSGDGTTPKTNRNRLDLDRGSRFESSMKEELITPLQSSVPPFDELWEAIRLVAIQFTDWGLLPTFNEPQSFMKTVGKELIPGGFVYDGFCSWIDSLSASSIGHNATKTPPRTMDVEGAGALIPTPLEAKSDEQKVFSCPECGRVFPQRKNLVRHVKTLPHPRKYKKRARPDDEEPRNKRRRAL